jgi:hypothetical protein
MGPGSLFSAWLPAGMRLVSCCAWYGEHAVGRGHGGENFAAAVVEFLP